MVGLYWKGGRFKHIWQEVQHNLTFLKVEWTNPKFHMSILIISNRMLVSTFKCKIEVSGEKLISVKIIE